MKKTWIIVPVLLLFILFGADLVKTKIWASEGVKTNPAATTIIAQTGAIASAEYAIAEVVSCSAICVFDIEIWNETDTIKLKSQRVWLAANIPFVAKLVYEYPIEQNIKMYIKMTNALTGSVQGSIILE